MVQYVNINNGIKTQVLSSTGKTMSLSEELSSIISRVKDRVSREIPDLDIFFLCQTDEEISLACRTEHVPEKTLSREDGWKAFRVDGPLDFSLIGILSNISTVLANAGIGIFVVSTYNTDYILVKAENAEKARTALEAAGHEVY